jgi:hypothetical protein
MKYISLDVETTGLDTQNHQLLSIGAVIEDTNNILPVEELPQIHIAILREEIHGSVFAINLNQNLISNINSYQEARTQEQKDEISRLTGTIYLPEEKVAETLLMFFWNNGITFDLEKYQKWSKTIDGKLEPVIMTGMPKIHITAAGKNFNAFDKIFLERIPKWKMFFYLRSRVIDPAIYFVDWFNDEALPSLGKCKERANINGVVTHNALEDAIDVLLLLRSQYGNKQLS